MMITLGGSDSNDEIYGYGGNDFIRGYDGNDIIYGGDGNDEIFGYEGDDKIFSGKGNDEIHAGSGNDYIYSEEGDNIIFGEEGDDTIFLGSGKNIVKFESDAQKNGKDIINNFTFGDGGDVLDFSAKPRITKIFTAPVDPELTETGLHLNMKIYLGPMEEENLVVILNDVTSNLTLANFVGVAESDIYLFQFPFDKFKF